MAPRIASSPRAFRAAVGEAYVCRACSSQVRYTSSLVQDRSRSSKQPSPLPPADIGYVSRLRGLGTSRRDIARRTTRSRQYAGSLASRTAINAPSTVAPELRELHQKLSLLQEKASSYVDLSRIQLAMRSLESEDPVTRIAFLGLGAKGQHAARKLVRALLADALSDEAEWERQLIRSDDGGNVLLRYGESQDSGVQRESNTVVREVRIPSPFLKRWNVEFLISGVKSSNANMEVKELGESFLDPALTIPGAGRVGFVRFPVHKAVLVAEGVAGAVDFGRLPSGVVDGKNIHAVLNLPRRAEEEDSDAAIDIDLASHALALFRASNANGAQFSSEWQASRVPNLTTWLAAATSSTTGLKLAVSDLISNITSRASSSIAAAEAGAYSSSTSLTIQDAKRASLQTAISTWSEEAHRDLQANLSTALVSPTWKRTTWWRLFWRIDEVSLSASDVLRRGWLVEAEQSLAWLSGRVVEAGVATAEELKSEPSTTGLLGPGLEDEVKQYKSIQGEDVPIQKMETVAELMQLPPMLAKVKQESGIDAMFDPPWPQTIHLARQQMLYRVVPNMHRRVQVLMLSSLSTIGGTAALGAWLWIASGGVALYEAGAVASLGLVWSLRRLQKKWGKERDEFVGVVREDGRRVLSDVEGRLTRLVSEGGRVEVSAEDVQEWAVARDAVEKVDAARKAVERRER